jgi:hypothetical protein
MTSPLTLGDIEQSKLRRKSVFSIVQRPQIGRQRANIEPPVRGACPNAQISKGMPPTLPLYTLPRIIRRLDRHLPAGDNWQQNDVSRFCSDPGLVDHGRG